jgi:hypothetical protein
MCSSQGSTPAFLCAPSSTATVVHPGQPQHMILCVCCLHRRCECAVVRTPKCYPHSCQHLPSQQATRCRPHCCQPNCAGVRSPPSAKHRPHAYTTTAAPSPAWLQEKASRGACWVSGRARAAACAVSAAARAPPPQSAASCGPAGVSRCGLRPHHRRRRRRQQPGVGGWPPHQLPGCPGPVACWPGTSTCRPGRAEEAVVRVSLTPTGAKPARPGRGPQALLLTWHVL